MNKDTLFGIQLCQQDAGTNIIRDNNRYEDGCFYGLDDIVRTGWLFPDDINLNYLLFSALTSIFNKTQFTRDEAEILQSPIYSLSFNTNEYSSTLLPVQSLALGIRSWASCVTSVHDCTVQAHRNIYN